MAEHWLARVSNNPIFHYSMMRLLQNLSLETAARACRPPVLETTAVLWMEGGAPSPPQEVLQEPVSTQLFMDQLAHSFSFLSFSVTVHGEPRRACPGGEQD